MDRCLIVLGYPSLVAKKESRTNKSVSFDLRDEFEVELLKHAGKEFNGKKQNFSKYVKRLIEDDMNGINRHNGEPGPASVASKRIFEEEELDPYTMEAMSGFL